MACSDHALNEMETSWDQEVSEEDVLDIVETFKLADLDDVYVRLGITQKVREDALLSDMHSPKKQAMNILNIWRNRKEETSTRSALIEAMEKCSDSRASLDELRKKWIMRPSEPVKKRIKTKPHPVVKEPCDPKSFPQSLKPFREELQEYYQDEMGQLPLLPWLEYYEMKHIDDIFVELEMATKEWNRKKPEKLQKYEDLVTLKHPTKKDKFATRVLVLGDAGSGKTSLMSKIAYSWSQQNHHSLAQFELVFYLRMRNLHSCNNVRHCLRKGTTEEDPDTDCSFLGEIFQQMPQTDVNVHDLQDYIKLNPTKILILLDGWDESVLSHVELEKSNVKKAEHDIENLLISKKQPSSCVIVTSRPYKSLGKCQASYIAVNVNGFADENVKEYIRKFFQNQIERNDRDIEGASENVSDKERESEIVGGDCDKEGGKAYKGELEGDALALYKHLKSSDTLENLAKIPVMLMLICWMWQHNTNLPEQQTKLYFQFVRAIWDRYCDKEKDHGDEHNELMKIGEIAFKGIKDRRLVFKESEMRELPGRKIGVYLGLLVEETHIVDLRTEKSVAFLHKSFQEYCAAYFLVNNPDLLGNFLESLGSWNEVLSKQEVLLFCCGLCSKFPGHDAAVKIIKHVIACCVKYGTQKKRYGRIHFAVQISRTAARYNEGYNILPVINLVNECGQINQTTLIQPVGDLIMSNKLIIESNHRPQTLSEFHQFVTLHGSSLCNIQTILSYDQSCASLDVISDTLRCMPNVSDVTINFSVYDRVLANETSTTQLGESIAALSKLHRLTVGFAHKRLAITVILDLLSQSPSKKLTHIKITRTHVGDAISHISGFIPHLKSLDLAQVALEDRHITALCDNLPNATCLEVLSLDIRPRIGNNALHTLFTQIHHCTKLTRLRIQATIDRHCSSLVTECLTAASLKKDYVNTCDVAHQYEDEAIQSLFSISRNAKIH